MKRFVKVYLTMLVVSLLAVNLVLVLLYGSQFFLNASSGSNITIGSELFWPLVIVNGAVLLVFLLLWFIARSFYRSSPSVPDGF